MLRVGLTGGIACGKSRVLRRLAERGCRTLDLDAVAREVSAPGAPALAEIARAFGPGVIDAAGALDRAALGAIVFGDATARERLNAIVHPRVRAAEAAWAKGFEREPAAVLVTDGALLIEAGVHLRFDRLLVVHCRPELQLRRLRERDGLHERAARARIEAQLSSSEKLAFAHFEIETSGSEEATDQAADALAPALRALAHARRAPADDVSERFARGLALGPDTGPRGLKPSLLLASAAPAGLEMEVLARRLQPPAAGAWYRAGEAGAVAPPATALGVAAVAWAHARAGRDSELAVAAAASVARLAHVEPALRADACLVALVALERAASAVEEGPRGPASRWRPLAARFGGAEPSGRLSAVWDALERTNEPAQAAVLAEAGGGDGAAAAALAGLRSLEEPEGVDVWRQRLQAAARS